MTCDEQSRFILSTCCRVTTGVASSRLTDRHRQFALSRRYPIPLPPVHPISPPGSPRPREPSGRCRRIAAWAPVVPISPCPVPLSQCYNANPTPTPRTTRWSLVKRRGCDPDMLGWSRSWDDLDAEHRCGLLLARHFFNPPPRRLCFRRQSRTTTPGPAPLMVKGATIMTSSLPHAGGNPHPLIHWTWQVPRQVPLTVTDARGLCPVFNLSLPPFPRRHAKFSSQPSFFTLVHPPILNRSQQTPSSNTPRCPTHSPSCTPATWTSSTTPTWPPPPPASATTTA